MAGVLILQADSKPLLLEGAEPVAEASGLLDGQVDGFGVAVGDAVGLEAVLVAVECTGNYGADVTRGLTEAGCDVREVNRSNRFVRRARACPITEVAGLGRTLKMGRSQVPAPPTGPGT